MDPFPSASASLSLPPDPVAETRRVKIRGVIEKEFSMEILLKFRERDELQRRLDWTQRAVSDIKKAIQAGQVLVNAPIRDPYTLFPHQGPGEVRPMPSNHARSSSVQNGHASGSYFPNMPPPLNGTHSHMNGRTTPLDSPGISRGHVRSQSLWTSTGYPANYSPYANFNGPWPFYMQPESPNMMSNTGRPLRASALRSGRGIPSMPNETESTQDVPSTSAAPHLPGPQAGSSSSSTTTKKGLFVHRAAKNHPETQELVQLQCDICKRTEFVTVSGFVNHMRLRHLVYLPSHEAAIQRCGVVVESKEHALPIHQGIDKVKSSVTRIRLNFTPKSSASPSLSPGGHPSDRLTEGKAPIVSTRDGLGADTRNENSSVERPDGVDPDGHQSYAKEPPISSVAHGPSRRKKGPKSSASTIGRVKRLKTKDENRSGSETDSDRDCYATPEGSVGSNEVSSTDLSTISERSRSSISTSTCASEIDDENHIAVVAKKLSPKAVESVQDEQVSRPSSRDNSPLPNRHHNTIGILPSDRLACAEAAISFVSPNQNRNLNLAAAKRLLFRSKAKSKAALNIAMPTSQTVS